VSKIFKLLLIFIFITNCSFHKNSKFWNKENIEEEKSFLIDLIYFDIFRGLVESINPVNKYKISSI